MVFLSNYLVFKIVLAALGRVDYPVAGDLELKYDTANKIYLSGGSLDYVDDATLYTTIAGETTNYELNLGIIQNKTTTTAYEVVLPSGSGHGTFGINQDATRYVHQYPVTNGYSNGKFQVYSGTPSGGYTTYGSEIQPFNGNEVMFCSMSADGKYILISTYNGGNDGYKMYKDNGSSYAYHSAYSHIGSHTSSGYTPAFVPSNNNFVITGTDNNSTWYFKLYVYNSATDTWTGKATVTPSGSSTSDVQRGLFSKGFTYDGNYLFLGGNGSTTRGEVWSVDWNANTMTYKWHTTEGNNGDGAGGAISPDNRYVVLCRHDGNPYRVYENTSGDWSTVVNVTSDFDLTGSGTSTTFGSYGISFSGYSSKNKTPLYIGQFAGYYGDGKFRLENWSKRSPYQIYITDAGKYSVDATIAGLKYKTNEVEVTGSITPVKSFPTTAQKLYPSDGGTVSDSDSYGYVGLSGNGLVMVIVGKGDDDTTTDSGGFMVYEKINGVWTYTQQITNVGSGSGTLGLSEEGKAVQLDYTGTRVFIGAHADDNSTTNTGSVYIYKRVAQGNWTLEQTLTGASGSYRYGYNDVNNDGDKLIIGSYGYPGSGNVGRVWYYTRSGTSWSLQDQLAAPSTSAYGTSVSINSTGTRAIIGGYTHSSNTGRADIWNYSSGSWSIGSGFTGVSGGDVFGWNVDMSNDGNTVVVGAPLYSAGGTEGRVYIYTTSDGTNWSLLKTLSNQDADEWFGFSVQISGDGNTVVIGAGKNDEGLTNRGKSYVYVKSGGSWPSTPTHTILGTTANANNGYTLGISDTGETIISGAPNDDDKGTNQGAVYIFDKSTLAELKFDNYNKLSIGNAPTNTSSKLFLGSNVYDIGTLTSDLTIETPGLYRGLVFDTSSNVAYFNKTTVGAIGTTMAGYEADTIIYGTVQSGASHGNSQGGFGNNTILNADGTRLLVTDPLNYSSGRGRAYIYHLESGSWVLKQTWDNPNNSGQRFSDGACMNEDGTRVFLMHSESEKVYTYEYASGAWPTANTGTHTISPGTIGSLCLNLSCNKTGDVLLIVHGRSQTSKIYRRASATSWSQDSGGSFSSMGDGGCINGDGTRAFLGRESDSTIHMTEWNGSTWSSLTQIINETDTTFPAAMACDSAGDTLVVKAATLADIDKSGIYERDSGTGSWSRTQDINGSTEIYGTTQPSISYDGTMVLVGSHHYDSSKGRAYLWQKSGGSWSLTKTYENPDASPASNDYWGSGTGIARTSKGTFVIGFQSDDTVGTDYGSVHIYTNAIPDFISFDTYNKLSLSGITNPTSKIHALPTGAESTTTYDIGSATNIYIESAGTYTAEMKGSDAFALDSTVATIQALPTRLQGSDISAMGTTNYTRYGVPSSQSIDVEDFLFNSSSNINPCIDFIHLTNSQDTFVFDLESVKTINKIRIYAGNTTPNWASRNTGSVVKLYNGSTLVYTSPSLTFSRSSPETYYGPYEEGKDYNTLLFTTGYTNIDKITVETPSTSAALGRVEVNDFTDAPSLNFDTYNKLTFTGADTDSTYKLKYESNTYDLGTISNVYIANPGTYSAEIKGATNFGLSSNTVSLTTPSPNSQLYYPLTSEPSANVWSSTTDVSYGSDGVTFNSTSSTFGLEFTVPTSGIFTVSCNFMKTSFTSGTGVIIASSTNQNSPELESNFTATSYAWRSTNTGYVNTTGLTHYTNQWYHMVWVHDKNNGLTAYLDGVEVYSYSGTIASPQTSFIVGPNYRSGTITNLFGAGGKMSDIRIYHTAISSTEAELIYKADNKYIPSLDFDTYNKLTFSGLESGSTSNVTFNGNTYSIGTASNVYIENSGTYEAESKGTTTFALTSNVVGTVATNPLGNYRSVIQTSSAYLDYGSSSDRQVTICCWYKHSNDNNGYTIRLSPNSDGSSYVFGTFRTFSDGTDRLRGWTYSPSAGSQYTYWENLPSGFDETKWNFYIFTYESNGNNHSMYLPEFDYHDNGSNNIGASWRYVFFDMPTNDNSITDFSVYEGNKATTESWRTTLYNNGQIGGAANETTDRLHYLRFHKDTIGDDIGSKNTDISSGSITPSMSLPGYSAAPSLTHDGYKLVVKNITPTSSKLKYESNTYDIGTATNIYVENTGAYTAEIGNATDFVFTNTTVSGTIKTIEPGFASRYQGSMALTYDGKLYAWGMNDDGEAGVGTSSDITVPTLCTGITQGTVAKLLSSSDLTDNSRGEVSAIKTTDGKIYMAGKGDNNCIPGETSDQTSFTDVTSYFGDQTLTANTVTMMSFTDRSGAALTETGNVWTWGTHDSTYKALGQAGASSSSTPKQINFSGATDNITKVTCGHYHTVALDSSGDVWFWGDVPNSYSSSWPSSVTDEPQKVVDGKNIIGIASSYYTLYAFDATGKMWNAGDNSEGQIGDGTTSGSTGKTLTEVTYFSSKGITINKVYGGGEFVFADTSDGYYCWGAGTHGVFGNGSTGNITSGPAKWTNVSNIKKFMASTQHTTAITEGGKYYAWGRDYHGGRGDSDSSSDISYPKYIDTLPNILAPSFDFDGYDKILAHMKPTSYVYEFFISVKLDGGSLNEWHSYGITTTSGTLTQSMLQIHPTISSGTLSDMFNGSYTSGTLLRIADGNHEVGTKIMTLTSPFELADITFYVYRPYYQPGYKIVLNGNIILNETTNAGTSTTPSPTSFTKTLSPVSNSLTKYTKGTTTYDVGKASIVTVQDPGTYDAQIKSGTDFNLKSATIPATSSTGLYTWAFHHGNFDNAYGDGDILTARENGRFYADTPSYTGDIGTITPTVDAYPVTYTFPFTSAYPVASDYSQISSFTNGNTGSGGTTIANGYMTMNGNEDSNDRMPKWETSSTHTEYSIGFDAYFDRSSVTNGTIFGGMETGGRFGLQYTTSNNTLRIYHARDGAGASSSYGTSTISDGVWYNIKIVFDITSYVKIYLDNVLEIDHALTGSNWTQNSPINSWYMGEKVNSNYAMGGMRIKNFDVYEGLWPVTEDISKTSYTFAPPSGGLTANVMMVAGGGGGGVVSGSGGGAGGLVYKQNESISTGAKTIVVGNGGYRINTGVSDRSGVPGKDTTFLGYTAIGGGAGSSTSSSVHPGGSGGAGTGVSSSDALQPTSTTGGFGNQGGTNDGDRAGGGGGGAGGAGENGNRSVTGGNGGIGKNYGNIFGTNYGENGWFAGGGGGGSNNANHPGVPPGFGGKGGGGNGHLYTNEPIHGKSHSGGGGGGGGWSGSNSNYFECSGGSGIVLLQTNIATPNVNSEVKVPKPDGFLVYNDNLDSVSRGPIPGSYSSLTIVNQPLPDGSEGPVFYNSDIYTYVGVGQSNTNQGDGSFQTIESVFMPIETGNYTHIASLMYSDSNLMTLGINGSNKLIIQHNNNQNHNSVTTLATSDYTMEHGKWHHLVLTTDYLGNAKAYVNGYLVASDRWASMNADKNTAMFYRIGVDNHAERKYMASTSRCYYSELSPKEIMQLASSVGLGPKLEYDGLNTIKILNTEPGSSVKLFTSNVADTSNVFIVADPAAGEYTVPESGKYYAEIKGTDTFTVTKTLDVSGTFPLYQYPPVVTGTKSSLTTSLSADTWNTWTMSGASTGNGQYQVKTSHTTNAPGGTNATAASLFTNGVKIEVISDGGASIYSFLHTSQLTNFDITLQLPSAKTIRKYVLYPADAAPVSTPGGSVDPTLPGGGGEHNTRRPKSWVLKGSNDSTSWTTIDTVTNKPPSIYGDLHTVSSPASYQYYQLSISEINGSSQFMQLGEWQLWGDA
ncbi:hypothetical protein BpV1_164 [Bathycoccus sp. RCC1105 virus BpV1]|uniref:regulator of chromosome condensation n=1 Tax=Bathycoccus sp. RCC1105 virus BpV1 TaxID=880159 RepID=UPI0001EF43F6|nr:regulator of chromosome condensation [Bathycoccus sp. RCC1105 virus BpV1]ADQ91791.1 hypothetical protein BpV1_164 [Bathycoccus sp. RCC1105 virus BpV1]